MRHIGGGILGGVKGAAYWKASRPAISLFNIFLWMAKFSITPRDSLARHEKTFLCDSMIDSQRNDHSADANVDSETKPVDQILSFITPSQYPAREDGD